MGGGAWWAVGAAIGAVGWLVASSRVERTVADRHSTGVAPRWLAPGGLAAMVLGTAATVGLTDRRVELPAVTVFAVALVLLGLIDAATFTLPRQLVWLAFAAGIVGLVPVAIADGDPGRIARAGAGAVIAVAVVWVLRVLTRGGVGFGDVRLAAPIGWFAAWVSWPALGRAGLIAVLVNGVVSAGLLASRRAGRRSKVPFGPALVAGALVTLWFR